MKKISGVLVAAVLGFFLLAGTALATPTLDFGIVAPTTGSISYAGDGAPLVGTDISVDKVTLTDGSHVVDLVFGGLLNFTTGTGAGQLPWSWGSGGSITLVGGVDTNHDGVLDTGDISIGTTLLTGHFGSASVYYDNGEFLMSVASFTDVKDETLLKHFDLPVGIEYAGNFNIRFVAPFSIGQPFSSNQVVDGDIFNTIPPVLTKFDGPTAVPEPSIMLLLGLALMGLAGIRRKLKE
jgi:hypothetical protein